MELSQPLSSITLFDSTSSLSGNEEIGLRLKASVNFNEIKGDVLRMKVGISPVSYENALLNIKKELLGWDFNATVKSADEKWNKDLNQ